MSDTHTHAHSWLRWRSSYKLRGWFRPAVRREVYRRDVLDGEREYRDVMSVWAGEPLDYILRDYLHKWDALQDKRHWGRRAIDRLQMGSRPNTEVIKMLKNLRKNWKYGCTTCDGKHGPGADCICDCHNGTGYYL